MSQGNETATALPIRIRGLAKSYGTVRALDAIDLDVGSGEFLTVLGPSGCGKTTLLMALAGFVRPDAGSIRFGSQEVILTPPHKRNVGLVFQSYALFPHMTVAENIAFPLKLRSIGATERDRRVEAALAKVRLAGLGDRQIDQLSGGQRQRVALARAFVFGPNILLMDEPLSALDKNLREDMRSELKALHRALGVTTVFVTHDQREALTMSDRIAVLNNGALLQVAPPEVIYNQPVDAFVAGFVGASSMLPLTRDTAGDLLFQGQRLGKAEPSDIEGEWVLVLRPERIFFASEEAADDQTIVLNGTLRDVVFEGDAMSARVGIAGGTELTMKLDGRTGSRAASPRSGDQVRVGLNREDAILVPRHQKAP